MPEEVYDEREIRPLDPFEKKAGAALAHHACGDLGYLQSRIDLDRNPAKMSLALQRAKKPLEAIERPQPFHISPGFPVTIAITRSTNCRTNSSSPEGFK